MVGQQDSISTYEQLLWDKVVKMNHAKENGQDAFFDELLDETEMLAKLAPELHKEFASRKKDLDVLVNANLEELKVILKTVNDDITRDIVDAQKKAVIQWEYRSDMLEMILNLLNEFQLIPYMNPDIMQVLAEPVEEVEAEPLETEYVEEPTEEIEEEEEPEPEPAKIEPRQPMQQKTPVNPKIRRARKPIKK